MTTDNYLVRRQSFIQGDIIQIRGTTTSHPAPSNKKIFQNVINLKLTPSNPLDHPQSLIRNKYINDNQNSNLMIPTKKSDLNLNRKTATKQKK